jgi:hypothetical protein
MAIRCEDVGTTRRNYRIDRIGERHGRLLIVGREVKLSGSKNRVFWICQCDCGSMTSVVNDWIANGGTRSCGCLGRERAKEASKTHGMTKTKLHRAWMNMRNRCTNPNSNQWHNYGGRGITVCDRWSSFEAFASDVGEPPSPRHSLDRIDNERGYEPGNVRWATSRQQGRNRRGLIPVELNGKTVCLTEACEAAGLPLHTVYTRIFRHHWSMADALSKPVRRKQASGVQA